MLGGSLYIPAYNVPVAAMVMAVMSPSTVIVWLPIVYLTFRPRDLEYILHPIPSFVLVPFIYMLSALAAGLLRGSKVFCSVCQKQILIQRRPSFPVVIVFACSKGFT